MGWNVSVPSCSFCISFLWSVQKLVTHHHPQLLTPSFFPLSSLILHSPSPFCLFIVLLPQAFPPDVSIYWAWACALCIGGPQVLFSTWIDEGRICPWLTSVNTAEGLTPDLHRATDSLSSLSWRLSTEILVKEIWRRMGREVFNFQKGRPSQVCFHLKENGLIYIIRRNYCQNVI